MGQTVCRFYVYYSGVDNTTVCRFELWEPLNQVTISPSARLPFHFVSLLLLALLLILSSCFVRQKGYTHCYVIGNLIPLAIYTVKEIIATIAAGNNLYLWSHYSQVVYFIYFAHLLYLPLSTATFLAMNLYTAVKRAEIQKGGRLILWISLVCVYVVAVLIQLLVRGSASNAVLAIYFLLLLVLGFVAVLSLLSLCCCTPSVSSARSRLGGSLLFVLVILILEMCSNLPVLNLVQVLFHVDIINATLNLAFCFRPMIFCLGVLSLLPTYRSVLFCSQGKTVSAKVAIVEEAQPDKIMAKPADLPQVPLSSRPQEAPPVAHPADPLPRLPLTQDFGAELTNPPQTAFYNHPTTAVQYTTQPSQIYSQPIVSPAPMMQAVPQPVYVAPSNVIPAEQYHLVPSQPSLITQYHVVSTPAPALTHHLVSPAPVAAQFVGTPVAPTNLMRFASQPNLTAMTSLQPAVSTPQLNFVTHSPFYIPN